MKKSILIVTIIFTACAAQAQFGKLGKIGETLKKTTQDQSQKTTSSVDLDFYTKIHETDSLSMLSSMEYIAKQSGKDYKFVEKSYSEEARGTIYFYSTPDNKDQLSFVIATYNKGGNPDLNISGQRVFKLTEVYGLFLDIYPTWKAKFSDKNTKEQLTDTDGEMISFKYENNPKIASIKRVQNSNWKLKF